MEECEHLFAAIATSISASKTHSSAELIKINPSLKLSCWCAETLRSRANACHREITGYTPCPTPSPHLCEHSPSFLTEHSLPLCPSQENMWAPPTMRLSRTIQQHKPPGIGMSAHCSTPSPELCLVMEIEGLVR